MKKPQFSLSFMLNVVLLVVVVVHTINQRNSMRAMQQRLTAEARRTHRELQNQGGAIRQWFDSWSAFAESTQSADLIEQIQRERKDMRLRLTRIQGQLADFDHRIQQLEDRQTGS